MNHPSHPFHEIILAIGQRIIYGLLILAIIIFLTHLGLDMALGEERSGSVLPAIDSTVRYLGRLIRLDLGQSSAASITLIPIPVIEVIKQTFTNSFALLGISLLLAAIIGVTLGALAARYRNSGLSLLILLASIIGISVPSFFAALLLQMLVIRMTQTSGRTILPVGGFGWDEHILLPVLVLAARPLAQIARITYVTISEIIEQDYVRTAHSKGLHPRTVMNAHIARNAIIPVLTTIGLSLRFSLASLPVVEFFFGWPGMGFTLLKSISRQDVNLTVALVVCLGSLFILVNILLDFSYRFIDPRLREAPPFIGRSDQVHLVERLKALLFGILDILAEIPTPKWLQKNTSPVGPETFQPLTIKDKAWESSGKDEIYQNERLRTWIRGTVGNFPLMIGGCLVGILILVVVFGPYLAPHSPYTTQGLTIEAGEFKVPPFEPGETYPLGTDVLGRDILSLILAGAQRTLYLAVLVVVARIAVGFILGALAGFFSNSWLDRILVGTSETLAAFPTLLLAMIFILAIGIRRGFQPFVIALCLVGWGETMQLVRTEVISILPKAFIEAAVSVGLRTPRLILSHILPNLVPTLISVAALEMGAVMMLLGELGFIGIFIGGGSFAELDAFAAPYHYADVPEWGALLSNVRPYARAYPWTAIYPALAFFIAILGFNIFGEGIRRMVDYVGVVTSRLVNRYTILMGLLLFIGVGWARGRTGATAFYRQQASTFDGQRAFGHVAALTDRRLDGRSLGTIGQGVAAQYIAMQFENLGLQAAGEKYAYFQTRKRSYQDLDLVPLFTINDIRPPPVYREDYAEYPSATRNLGHAEGPVRYLSFGELTQTGTWNRSFPALKDLDFEHEILMVSSERDAALLRGMPRAGILIIADNPVDLNRHNTLSPIDPRWRLFGTNRMGGQDTPVLWINETTAERLLERTGYSLTELETTSGELGLDEILEVPLGISVTMNLEGSILEKVEVNNIIGHLPGTASNQYGGLDHQLIVVLAQYDNPPQGPSGKRFPGANDNASGVAVMLEAARTMQESEYLPYRTFLFVAYSGEGFEGGARVMPEISKFLQTKYGFSTNLEPEAIVDLRGLGFGETDNLVLQSGGNLRLINVFEDAARQMGVKSTRGRSQVDLSIVFEERSPYQGGQEAPYIQLSWEGWESTSRQPTDTLESISADRLQQAGRTISLALMTIGRELDY